MISLIGEGGDYVTDFENIYIQYFKDVYLFVKGLSGDDIISEEITEETFFKAIKSIDNFKGDCDIRVWLCQIAKNTYYTYCKNQNRTVSVSEELFETISDDFLIDEKLIDSEVSFQIHEFIHKMSEPYKEVFSLRIFGELSYAQIGKIFGKTESWARVTYHRAKLKIINCMEAQEK